MKRLLLIAVIFAALGARFGETAVAQSNPVVPPWRFQLPWKTETSQMTVADQSLVVEVADTDYLRSRGLSYRAGLDPGTGMLFVYNAPKPLTFWMYEMQFCLDIIWINNGEIRGAAESVCPVPGAAAQDLPIYASPEPVQYVLEVPAGWLKDHDFSVGTPVQIDSSLTDKDDPS
jgi:uncharacterized membrane protein (UPF0127 family)